MRPGAALCIDTRLGEGMVSAERRPPCGLPGAARFAREATARVAPTSERVLLALVRTAPGGMVIAPPFDAPWSTPTYRIRIAVLADPQGARFSASKFVALPA